MENGSFQRSRAPQRSCSPWARRCRLEVCTNRPAVSRMGACSGFALKKAGKVAAGVFGTLFLLQQALAYQGYVTVNWEKVEKDMTAVLDLNKDGKFDAADVNTGYMKVLKVCENNTAGLSGGFAAGFLLGVRAG
ncbi:unnamed protein product [Effrenium voratum]|nr:unnamed protein product [Effrenium voratum]CAJ1432704.1 unnamed protein product [Effrenium voratum]